MNLSMLNTPLPKSYLEINAHVVNCDSSTTQHLNTTDVTLPDGSEFSSGQLKLEQTLINPIPDAGSIVLSAPSAQDGRLLVSSDNLGAQLVAFQSDVSDEIVSTDTLTSAKCNDGNEFIVTTNTNQRIVIDDDVTLKTINYVEGVGGSGARLVMVNSNGTIVLNAGDLSSPSLTMNPVGLRLSSLNQKFQRIMDANQDSAQVYSPYVGYQVYRDEIGDTYQIFRDSSNVERIRVDSQGVQICSQYRLPLVGGSVGDSLQTSAPGITSWVTPPPSFSSYSRVTVSGIAAQSIIGSVLNSTTTPANSFSLGSSWKIRFFGTYNVAAAQTVVLSVLIGGVSVALTPALGMENSPASWSSEWTLTVQAVGVAGVAKMALNNTSRMDATVTCSTSIKSTNIDTTISNVVGLTAQLSVANADTFICESVSFSRVV